MTTKVGSESAGGEGAGGAGGAAGGAGGNEGEGKKDGSLLGGARSEGAKADEAKTAEAKAAADKKASEEKAALEKELEGKTDAQKAEILKKREDAAKAAAEYDKPAPEKEYAAFKLPEGYEIQKPALDKFTALAKKFNLSQGKAQELVDLQLEVDKARGDAALAEFEKVTEDWKAETLKAYGPDYAAAESDAGRAIEWAEGKGIKGLREFLDASRAGNRLPMFQLMRLVGRAVAEDKLHVPGAGGGKKEEPKDGKVFYPEGAVPK